MTKYGGDVVQIQIQICKLKQGHSGEVGEAPQGENFPSPAIQPVGNDQLTCASTWQLPCQAAGPRQSSIQINFWYLCCKLIYNDIIAPLDKQIMSQ